MIRIPAFDHLFDDFADAVQRNVPVNGNNKILDGTRNTTLSSLAGTMRRRGCGFDSIHAALSVENSARCEPPLDENEVQSIARSIARYAPAAPAQEYRLTDIGAGQRFADHHRGKIRYSHEMKSWLVWDGRRWTQDNEGRIIALAKQTIAQVYEQAASEREIERRKALARYAARMDSDGKIKAMLSLAQSEPGIPLLVSQLDGDPWLFNCNNGVIDLHTGTLLPHDPGLLCTKIALYDFDPGAKCDLFRKFLHDIMAGDADLISFLQRFFGYCLTGDVSEHAVLFCYGTGSNGKTTLLNAMLKIMGEHASPLAPNLLLAKHSEPHPTELADLCGRRFVTAIETNAGKRFDIAKFKWLTGGDNLKGRFMNQNFFDFTPTHKIAVATNHKPIVTDTTDSFWRRMRCVPFEVKIRDEDQVKDLDEKFLCDEAPGILAWLVEGCSHWQELGLGAPKKMTAATMEYREEQDWLKPFLDEVCVIDPDGMVAVTALYERFKEWANAAGEKEIPRKTLSRLLTERGYVNKAGTGNRHFWHGLTLQGSK